MKLLHTFLLAGVLTGATSTALADEQDEIEAQFDGTGIIDQIDFETRRIIVGDRLLLLSDDTIVHSRSSDHDSLGRLHRGTGIAYRTSGAGKPPIITEIWLAPNSGPKPSYPGKN